MLRSPSLPYVLPFAGFVLLLGLVPLLDLGPRLDQIVRLGLIGAVLITVSRSVLDLRVPRWIGSVAVGVLVFILWVLPDLVFPGYREGILFSNSIFGTSDGAFAESGRTDSVALALRFTRAAVLVPIVEELFWRGWLPRWIINHDFERVPMGTYTAAAFWITAVGFALEHGSYWDVGLAAGIVYNWWMYRTRSLGDCILAHAVTNACLSGYVILMGAWRYW